MTGSRRRGAPLPSAGFALLEILIALLIILLGTLLITRGEMQLHQVVQRAVAREQSQTSAQSRLEVRQACAMSHDWQLAQSERAVSVSASPPSLCEP
ncbi:MAG: hypothetical protein ACRCRW_10460 [Aeromonadaceae bacterium]